MSALIGPKKVLFRAGAADAGAIPEARWMPDNSQYDTLIVQAKFTGGAGTGTVIPTYRKNRGTDGNDDTEFDGKAVELELAGGGNQIFDMPAIPGYQVTVRVAAVAATELELIGRYQKMQ